MSQKSSKTQERKLVILTEIYPDIEAAAIHDSKLENTLYTVPTYVREILESFLEMKKKNPALTPKMLLS